MRRLRGQLIKVFKILKGFDVVNLDLFVLEQNSITRSNGLKLTGKRFKTNKAKNYFVNNIVKVWNVIPNSVVASESINQFKNRLDKHFTHENLSLISRMCNLNLNI